MKIRVKETGEILNIAEWARVTADHCDGLGCPIEYKYDEVEFIQDETFDNVDWGQRRFELAKDLMAAIFSRLSYDPLSAAVCCCRCDDNPNDESVNPYSGIALIALKAADAVIEKLKTE